MKNETSTKQKYKVHITAPYKHIHLTKNVNILDMLTQGVHIIVFLFLFLGQFLRGGGGEGEKYWELLGFYFIIFSYVFVMSQISS